MKKFIILVIVSSFFASAALCQEAPVIITYTPDAVAENISQELKSTADNFKSTGYYSNLSAFRAVREEDPSACPSCKGAYLNSLFADRYTAEGRCEQIKDTAKRQFCEAIKTRNCAGLSSAKKPYCEGMLAGDVDMMVKARISAEKNRDRQYITDEVLFDMGVYSGYKYYSESACERYVTGSKLPLDRKLACQVLFSGDAGRILDEIAMDIAAFEMSRRTGNMSYCDNIKVSTIKKGCRNSAIKGVKDLFSK